MSSVPIVATLASTTRSNFSKSSSCSSWPSGARHHEARRRVVRRVEGDRQIEGLRQLDALAGIAIHQQHVRTLGDGQGQGSAIVEREAVLGHEGLDAVTPRRLEARAEELGLALPRAQAGDPPQHA
jgi:hypothetical protein